MMKSCKKVFISGRVQGVFFRDSTRQMAIRYAVCGGVRNLRDGRVEVQLFGEAGNIELMEKWLETGPKMANVTTIVSNESNPDSCDMLQSGDIQGFSVWPDA